MFAACGDAESPSGGDAGASAPDAGVSVSASERAACENVLMLEARGAGCGSGGTEEACFEGVAQLRTDYVAPGCEAEWETYLLCVTSITMCVSGQQCPEEFDVLEACGS